MELLNNLRKHLLESPLKLKAADLITFVRNGKIISHQGDTNKGFGILYDAHIVLMDYNQPPGRLFFLVNEWVSRNQANHNIQPYNFDADIIDHKKVDVEIVIAIEESVSAAAVEGGTQLTHHGVDPIDIGLLDATEWNLYINPAPDPIANWIENG